MAKSHALTMLSPSQILLLLLPCLLLGHPVRAGDTCKTTAYITTHQGKVSMQEALDRWVDIIREWQEGRSHHELVTLQISGAPCGGVLSDWTLQLRAHSTDFAVFLQVILQHEFEFVRHLFPDSPPTTIIDLGGNCGLASLFLASQFPTARVVLVEPMTTNFLTAQMNTFQYDTIYLEHGAIWGHMGHIEISGNNVWGKPLKETHNEWAVTVKEVPKADRLPVKNVLPGITLPYLMDKYHFPEVDFLKIDVEGAEVSLFSEENKPQLWLPRVRCFSIEIHSWASGFPPDWKNKTFSPLVLSLGFKSVKEVSELSIWCKPRSAAPGRGGSWRRLS